MPYPAAWWFVIVVDMKKRLATGIVLAAALCAAGWLIRRHGAAKRGSGAPASFPIMRALWPVTEDIRQLAPRCRWRDVIEGRRSADTDQHLRQPMPGE